MFCLSLHALQVALHALALPPLKVWHRYVSILGLLWFTFGEDGCKTESQSFTVYKTTSRLRHVWNSTLLTIFMLFGFQWPTFHSLLALHDLSEPEGDVFEVVLFSGFLGFAILRELLIADI